MELSKRQKAFCEASGSAFKPEAYMSFGACPGCETCMDDNGYTVEKYAPKFPEREPTRADRYHLAHAFFGMVTVSPSDVFREEFIPAAELVDGIMSEVIGADRAERAFREDWHGCLISDEGSFSGDGCGLCGMRMGSTLYVYHWVDRDGAVMHETDGCGDCLMFHANGDVPEDECLEWTGKPQYKEDRIERAHGQASDYLEAGSA